MSEKKVKQVHVIIMRYILISYTSKTLIFLYNLIKEEMIFKTNFKLNELYILILNNTISSYLSLF
jgi:hypothetical protein